MAQRGEKKIKIYVDKDDGNITKVKILKDDGGWKKADEVDVGQPCQYIGTVLFCKESNPGNCIVIEAGGYAWKVCW